MRDLTLIVQTSLDGYVAGKNGGFENFIGGEENLEFVCSIIEEADAVLLGRKSFDLLNKEWPTAAAKPGATTNVIKYSNWYNAAVKYVLSKTPDRLAKPAVRFISSDIIENIKQIKQQPGRTILMFGSPSTVHSLLSNGLIDHCWMIIHPVIFGEGIPLFRDRGQVIKTDLVKTHRLPFGTICLKYSLIK